MLREKELVLLENLKTDNERKTEEIQQLRNNQLIGQASGEETATITDGALAFANILEETEIEVEGKKKKAYLVGLPQGISRQEQREGYNILPNLTNIENTNIGGVNYSIVNNEIIAKGTATSGINKRIATTKITLKANTAYTFVLFTKGTAQSSLGSQAILFGTDSISNKISIPFNSDSNSLKNFTSTEDYTFDRISLYVGGTSTGSGIYIDVRIKIMILEGTYTTENLPAYEQYGETPSIEIPSEIENVKAWNLIDVEQIAQQTQNVITTFDKKNGWLTIENSNSNMAYVNILVPVEHIIIGKTYSLKVEFKSEEGCNVYLQKSAEDYSNFTQGIDDIIKNTAIDTYMKVLITPIANQIVTVRLSLAEEQEKIENKTYAPYGVIPISIGNKNLLDVTKLSDAAKKVDINYDDNFNIIDTSPTTDNRYWDYERCNWKDIELNLGTYTLLLFFSKHTTEAGTKARIISSDNNMIGEGDIINKDFVAINFNMSNKNKIGIIIKQGSGIYKAMLLKGVYAEENLPIDYIEYMEQNYNLHIGDLELNGINDIRDNFVVELNDASASVKSIKKLYLKKVYNEKNIINFISKHNSITSDTKGFFQFKIDDKNENINSNESVNKMKANYLKFRPGTAQQTFDNYDEGIWNETTKNLYAILPFTTLEDANNWLQELNTQGNPLKILYPLETPELIDLTDDFPELVQDIEYLINNFKTFKEVTHVEVDNGYIDLEYVKSTELALKNIQQQIDNISALMLEGGTGNA